MNAKDPCPCDSTRLYAQCCGRFHAGEPAPTAEALMRSRYSAFVLHNDRYLLATWHPSSRPKEIEFEPKQKWLGLKIVAAGKAEVEFIARYRVGGGSAARLHELSRFVKQDERWLYVDGLLSNNDKLG